MHNVAGGFGGGEKGWREADIATTYAVRLHRRTARQVLVRQFQTRFHRAGEAEAEVEFAANDNEDEDVCAICLSPPDLQRRGNVMYLVAGTYLARPCGALAACHEQRRGIAVYLATATRGQLLLQAISCGAWALCYHRQPHLGITMVHSSMRIAAGGMGR